MRQKKCGRADEKLDLATDDIGDGGRLAFVGDRYDLQAARHLQKFDRQVIGRAGAGAADSTRALTTSAVTPANKRVDAFMGTP